jgi:hypothetical protein
MLRKREEKPKRELLRKSLKPNKRELLVLKIPQVMSSPSATFSPLGTIPLFTLLISPEEKLLQELLEE